MKLCDAKPSLRWWHWPAGNNAGPSLSASCLRLKGCEVARARLDRCTAMVLGLGAVGASCFAQLARLGIGHLYGVDPDSYDNDSWLTQPVFQRDAGRSKAEVQGERAHAISVEAEVHTAHGVAQDLPLRVLKQADVFVCAGDNLELLVWAGHVAAALGKPLIQGAVHGESWTAIARVFDLRNAQAACPACVLNRREWSSLRARQGCTPSAQAPEATRTLPMVCGTAAQLAATEALKWLLGMEDQALHGEEAACCLRSHRMWRSTLSRNPHCRCPHRRWTVAGVDAHPANMSLAQLASQLNTKTGGQVNVIIRGERPWIGFTVCGACGRQVFVRRFAGLGDVVGKCVCGTELVAGPVGGYSSLPVADRRMCWDVPLEQLGVVPGDAIGFAEEENWSYFIIGR